MSTLADRIIKAAGMPGLAPRDPLRGALGRAAAEIGAAQRFAVSNETRSMVTPAWAAEALSSSPTRA